MFKTTLVVDGMMCAMCEQHVREAVQKALDERRISVKKITASRKKKEVAVLAETPVEELRRSGDGLRHGRLSERSVRRERLLLENLLFVRLTRNIRIGERLPS